MNVLLWILFIAAGFLAGSVMFCSFVPKAITRKDVSRLSDDGNPGAFNVFKICGAKVGCLCLFLDVLKGFAPVLCASLLMNTESFWFSLVIAAPVLGHAVGAFNHFRGGKCIAVSFGVAFGLIPVTCWAIVLLAGLYILFSTVFKFSSNRVRSITVYALFAVLSTAVCCVFGQYSCAAGCAAVALIAIVKHLKVFSQAPSEVVCNDK